VGGGGVFFCQKGEVFRNEGAIMTGISLFFTFY